MRQLYPYPYRTHNNLLHLISEDQLIDVQLHLGIMKYVMSNLKSTNSLVRLSTQLLCMNGVHTHDDIIMRIKLLKRVHVVVATDLLLLP